MLDIFGSYGTLIGQALSIIAIATLLVQLGRWWTSKKGPHSETRVYFVLLLAVIISTNIFAMLRSLDEIEQSQKIELANLHLNNVTLQNQQMIKQVLKQGDKILNETKHVMAGRGSYVPLG